jgi:hypothetical protein
LAKLQVLVLYDNYFSGDLPLDQMANLQELQTISLEKNRNIQGSIERMLMIWPHLEQLNVATTHVSGSIPTEVGLLTNLQSLELFHADIIGTLPTELGNLKELRKYSIYTG